MTRLEWVPLNPILTVFNQTIKAIQIAIKKILIEVIQSSKAGVMQATKIKSCIKFLRPSNSRSFKEKEKIMALSPRCIPMFDRLEDPSTDKRSELKNKSKELTRNKSEGEKDSI